MELQRTLKEPERLELVGLSPQGECTWTLIQSGLVRAVTGI